MSDKTSKATNRKVVKRGYHSSSSSSASDDDEDSSAISLRPRGLTREAQLQKDLNFNDRYETVKFSETPFTLAQTAAGRRERSSDPSNSQDKKTSFLHNRQTGTTEGWQITRGGTSSKSKNVTSADSANAPKKKIGGNIKVATADPDAPADLIKSQKVVAKRWPASTSKQDSTGPPQRKKNNLGGWQVQGAPITLVKKKPEPTAKTKRGRKTKVQKDQEEAAKNAQTGSSRQAGKKGKPTAAKKARTETEEKITFSRIPAGAGPSPSFPILQGLQKQRELSTSQSKGKPVERFPLRDSLEHEVDTDTSDFNLDKLFEGLSKGADRDHNDTQADASPKGASTRQSAVKDTKRSKSSPKQQQAPFVPSARGDQPQHTIAQILSPDPPSVVIPIEDAEGGESVDVELPSSEEEPLDPVLRQQRDQLLKIKIALQQENPRYRQEREAQISRSDGLSAESPREGTTDGTHFDETLKTQMVSSWTTKVPSTFTNPKYGTSSPFHKRQYEGYNPPSTITQVSIPSLGTTSRYFDPSSSSYDLPYSSPLADRRSHIGPSPIHHPQPRPIPGSGSARVEILESWADQQHRLNPSLEHPSSAQNRYQYADQMLYGHNNSRSLGLGTGYLQHDAEDLSSICLVNYGDRQAHVQTKRTLVPDLPPAYRSKRRRKPLQRPLTPPSGATSPSATWSTLKPPARQSFNADNNPSSSYRTSGSFKLPISKLTTDIGSSASKASSADSSRASWFKPPPAQVQRDESQRDHTLPNHSSTRGGFKSPLEIDQGASSNRLAYGVRSMGSANPFRGQISATHSREPRYPVSSDVLTTEAVHDTPHEVDWRWAWAKADTRDTRPPRCPNSLTARRPDTDIV